MPSEAVQIAKVILPQSPLPCGRLTEVPNDMEKLRQWEGSRVDCFDTLSGNGCQNPSALRPTHVPEVAVVRQRVANFRLNNNGCSGRN